MRATTAEGGGDDVGGVQDGGEGGAGVAGEGDGSAFGGDGRDVVAATAAGAGAAVRPPKAGFSNQHAFKAAMSTSASLFMSKASTGTDAARWTGLIKSLVGGAAKPSHAGILRGGWAEVDRDSWTGGGESVSFGGHVPPSWLPLLAEVLDEHHGLGLVQAVQVQTWARTNKEHSEMMERLRNEVAAT